MYLYISFFSYFSTEYFRKYTEVFINVKRKFSVHFYVPKKFHLQIDALTDHNILILLLLAPVFHQE